MEVSYELHSLATLLTGKVPQFPLARGLDGPQSWSGHGGKEKFHCLIWELNPGHSAHSPVITLNELAWLLNLRKWESEKSSFIVFLKSPELQSRDITQCRVFTTDLSSE
jgi:hypothetical protein